MKLISILFVSLICITALAKENPAARKPSSAWKDDTLTFLYYVRVDGSVDVFAGVDKGNPKSLEGALEAAVAACAKKHLEKSCNEMPWEQPNTNR